MKRLRARLAVVVALLAVMSAAARAQDTLVAKGDVAKPPTFEGLMAAINKSQTTIDSLLVRQVINESDLIVVDTKPLITGQGEANLKIQLERHDAHIKQLREILSKHPAVGARLKKESANPSISEIIGAEVLADGKIQLYYRKT